MRGALNHNFVLPSRETVSSRRKGLGPPSPLCVVAVGAHENLRVWRFVLAAKEWSQSCRRRVQVRHSSLRRWVFSVSVSVSISVSTSVTTS